MRAVLDTNILIDYLLGQPQAAEELKRYDRPVISRITWMEVLSGAQGEAEESEIREFLRLFEIQELTPEIAEEAVSSRQEYRMRLPDAIVLATARVLGCLLVTRNTKDFNPAWPEVRMPYRL